MRVRYRELRAHPLSVHSLSSYAKYDRRAKEVRPYAVSFLACGDGVIDRARDSLFRSFVRAHRLQPRLTDASLLDNDDDSLVASGLKIRATRTA